jgi:phosphoglycolate phosphatase
MIPTLLLDLDGTLVDSAPDLAAALNRLAVSRGFAPFTRGEVVGMIGNGARALVRKALEVRGEPFDEPTLDAFVDDYTTHIADESRLYPDVIVTLERFAAEGWRLAVCTNKPVAPSRRLLEALGLSRFMAAVGGGDSFPTRKPDPAHLLATLAAAGGAPAAAVMVGDHANDVGAALGAGVPCIFALWGYGPAEMGAAASARALRFSELPGLASAALHGR